ncbi:MAG: hypothetical protein IJA27_00825 [Lachnospiraceae bacterium]|nr:hypothetical protein [Lachnospiraceae bacterium]
MANKENRVKKWMQYHKPFVISVAVVIIYTLIMLGIIFGLGFDFHNCSSGSLSDVKNQEVEIETSMNR